MKLMLIYCFGKLCIIMTSKLMYPRISPTPNFGRCFWLKKCGLYTGKYGKQDVDVAHRVPTGQATAGPRRVICKFTRRIVKEEVVNWRKEACKVSATSIGLPANCFLRNVRIFDHLTPKTQKLLADAKKFQARNGFRFCWSKNFVLSINESLRTLVPSSSKGRKTLNDFHAKRTYLWAK